MWKVHSFYAMELRAVRWKGNAIAAGASEKTNSDVVLVTRGYIHEISAPAENNAGRLKSRQLRPLSEME